MPTERRFDWTVDGSVGELGREVLEEGEAEKYDVIGAWVWERLPA